ncbi:hypothetical protein PSTG_04095 [Puccinia striiformis f. sp. tritici PST-78]|uniref:Reverse transcriptase domain-containing protein n=1 Tax=Puccinia striiformis f. sp. tritici PST-78 TaxID=1165861 RepID=A0A0L0VUW7_9BASI|nr:hypothetical protein PSTG_04095 [Puccinia striiformis f. sp. tritici PST-78]
MSLGTIETSQEVANQKSHSKATLWPDSIVCEMNTARWAQALGDANLLPEYQDVLDGFQHGFDQGIPEHDFGIDTPYFAPPNHSSALLAKDKIEQSIEKELMAGRMFGPYSIEQLTAKYKFFRTNPLGAVTNRDGSVRPVNDLSFPRGIPDKPSVNSFVDKDNYTTTWDDFKIVSRFLRRQDSPLLLAIFDWEKAYRQIPTAKSQWKYLMVRDFNDQILMDTRIAFGGVAGCGSFGRPADAWKQIMLHEFDLVEAFRWVDDNLFIKTPESDLSLEDIVKRSEELGVKTNPTKISPFKEEQKYIGFIWNATHRTVRLPDDKKFQRIQQIKDFLTPDSTFSFKQAERMAGRLNHVSYMLPQLQCYLNGLYRWMNNWVHKNTEQALPIDAKDDLEMWLKTLLFFKETRLIQNPDPTDIGWVGDTSTSYGIGVLIGKRWAQFQLRKEWNHGPEPKRNIAWLETVAIRLGIIALSTLKARRGKNFIVWTDNTTTESTLGKKKATSKHVNEEWKMIQSLLINEQLDVTARRVTSKENPADTLSRGNRSGHTPKLQIFIAVPDDLEERLFQV